MAEKTKKVMINDMIYNDLLYVQKNLLSPLEVKKSILENNIQVDLNELVEIFSSDKFDIKNIKCTKLTQKQKEALKKYRGLTDRHIELVILQNILIDNTIHNSDMLEEVEQKIKSYESLSDIIRVLINTPDKGFEHFYDTTREMNKGLMVSDDLHAMIMERCKKEEEKSQGKVIWKLIRNYEKRRINDDSEVM